MTEIYECDRIDHHAIDIDDAIICADGDEKYYQKNNKTKVVRRQKPEGGIKAWYINENTGQEMYEWVVLPKNAVSGKKCWNCKAPLTWNPKTRRATYQRTDEAGDDSCICNGCTPGDLIANARDTPKRNYNRK